MLWLLVSLVSWLVSLVIGILMVFGIWLVWYFLCGCMLIRVILLVLCCCSSFVWVIVFFGELSMFVVVIVMLVRCLLVIICISVNSFVMFFLVIW